MISSRTVRAVVQRVAEASCRVSGETVGAIGPGLVVLLGVGVGDAETDADYLADKVLNLRVFPDEAGQMNRSVLDVSGGLLVVSQFTLLGDVRKGRRPSYSERGPARGGEPALRALRVAAAAVGPPRGHRRLPRLDGRRPREPGPGHDPPRLAKGLLTMAALVRSRAVRVALRVLAAAAGLLLFVLALELLKRGAGGVGPLLRAAGVSGLAGGLGAGWLGACLLLSGSPVAAVALTLLASGTLTPAETFGMISGSRLGASFVVLVVGVLEDLRAGRREARSAYIGVTALVATAVTYLPAMGLSWLAFERGALDGLRLEGRDLEGIVERLYGPLLHAASATLPRAALFAAGVVLLLLAFRAFDRALPDLAAGHGPLLPADHVAYRPWFMFGVGLATTVLTLSVSVSISLLVPLAARGFVRRENVWPYVLGANVTTLVDTLFAGALVGHPDSARMVALLMGSVAALSLPPVFLFPDAFSRRLDRVASMATGSARAVAVFVALLFAIPLALVALF